MFVAKVKILFTLYITSCCYKDTLDSEPAAWLLLNVCTTRTDGHESKAFWCGRQHKRGSAWSRQVGAMGQQLSQELRYCKAVGRTQGAASLLPEL